jgi:hypothetical protein
LNHSQKYSVFYAFFNKKEREKGEKEEGGGNKNPSAEGSSDMC